MPTPQSFSTVLIGRCVLIREGIARILRGANFRIPASVSSADSLPTGKLQPRQLLFLIVHAGDDIDVALEQVKLLRDSHPGGRTAIVADHYRLDDVAAAFRAGVNGYFVDIMTCDLFTKSVELVAMGETIFPPAFLTFALAPERLLVAEATPHDDEGALALLSRARDTIAPQLSPREQSILQCLIAGHSNKSIARKIDIAEATVKVHVKAILRKIRVQNRTQAAVWGINHGSPSNPTSNRALPSIVDAGLRTRNGIAVSAPAQIAPSGSPGVINSDANHVEVPRLDDMISKSINRRTNGNNGMARLHK